MKKVYTQAKGKGICLMFLFDFTKVPFGLNAIVNVLAIEIAFAIVDH